MSAAKPKSYTHQVIDAVHASSLSPLARLLLLTMAYAADRTTGIAWHGQATLAAMTGMSERTIRTLLAELSTATPVRVERAPRFVAGRGHASRTSDVWRLVLVGLVDDPEQPARDAAWSEVSNRQDVPVGRVSNRQTASEQPANDVGATGKSCTEQLAPRAGDPLRSDPVSDPVREPEREQAAPDGALSLDPPTTSVSEPEQTTSWRIAGSDYVPDAATERQARAVARQRGADYEHELSKFRVYEFKSSTAKSRNQCLVEWMTRAHPASSTRSASDRRLDAQMARVDRLAAEEARQKSTYDVTAAAEAADPDLTGYVDPDVDAERRRQRDVERVRQREAAELKRYQRRVRAEAGDPEPPTPPRKDEEINWL